MYGKPNLNFSPRITSRGRLISAWNKPKRMSLYKRKRRFPMYRSMPRAGGWVRDSTVSSGRVFPLGRTLRTKLRYCEELFEIDSTAGIITNYVFSANGLYDPNITGAGHQPVGWDQLIAMYDHAVVIGAKITVTFRNSDATYANFVGIRMSDTATGLSDMTQAIENGACITKLLENNGNNGSVITTLSYRVNPNKYLGISKPMSSDRIRNSSSSNPTDQCYFHVMSAALNTSVNPDIISCQAVIEYDVVFIEPKALATS